MNYSTPLLAATSGLWLGGSTTFLLNLGRALRERSVALPIVNMTGENEMPAEFENAGLPVHPVFQRGMIYEDRIQAAYLFAAAQRPAAVLACLASDSFEVLRVAPCGVARLGVIQSDDPGPYEMARNYAPWLDGMVGVSQTICRRLRADSAFAGIRIESIPYGIHFGPAAPGRWSDPAQPLRIIYLGRVIEIQKRVSRLIELARLLGARGERFELTFAGSGPQLDSTKEALGGLPNVRFLGDVRHRDIPGLLRSQDVFVLLSDFEGLPLSLLEAMGEGVVPVVSDLESGMRDIVTAETGFRVPVGNVAAAAEVISLLKRERSRLAALSSAASQLARSQYNATRMAEGYLKLAGEMTGKDAAWPASVRIPAPLLLRHSWMYQGFPRRVRRVIKRALSFTTS